MADVPFGFSAGDDPDRKKKDPTPGSDPSWFGFLLMVREDAPFRRDEIVAHLEARRVQTRMLFAGNLARQPALTELVRDRSAAAPPFRAAGPLTNTDAAMNRAFWVGVYPGITPEMRAYVAEEIRAFSRGRRPLARRA